MYATIHEEMIESISHLDEATQGKIMLAYIKYQMYGVEPSQDDMLVYSIFKAKQFDLDSSKTRAEVARENGQKGGRPRKDLSVENLAKTKKTQQQPKNNPSITQKNHEKEKEKEKENIISLSKDKEKQSFGNEDINNCLDLIKKFNGGILDGTIKEQRQYGKLLIDKLNKLESIESGNYTRNQVLETILQIVSQNTYHAQKITGPKKIYYELGGLMQICKSEYSKHKKIPFIPGV